MLAVAMLLLASAQFSSAADAAVPEKPYNGTISELKVEPTSLTLSNKLDFRRVLVSGKTPDGLWVDLSHVAKFDLGPANQKSPAIVRQDSDGYFVPLADGETKVQISALGKSATLPLVVKNLAAARPISFVRDIMPVLSKSDCNSGPCHGTPKGKNGFKLSLRGYDPEWDHEQLVDDLSSRRFNRSRPKDSLMLVKPVAAVPHVGGQRFGEDSIQYAMFMQWIKEGNQSDVAKTTRAVRLSVYPQSPVLRDIGATQDLLVLAHFADGSTRDVTRDAVYTSSHDYIAKADAKGRIQGLRRGEAAVLVRYESNYITNYVSVVSPSPGYAWDDVPSHNYIDTLVYDKLKKLKLKPSKMCNDDEFIRRVSLDLIGIAPTPEEVRAFVDDRTPTWEKRTALVDRLLDRPEYVDRWTHKWADLLQCNRKFLGEKGVWAFRNWLREQVASNRPIDEFVYDLMTSTGSTYETPATNYFRVCRDPLTAMENMTQLFLGTRFACNKCHDHPFERWTQSQHYELGAFFAKVGRKPGSTKEEEFVFDRHDAGEPVTHPRTNAIIPAKFPFEHAGKVDATANPRKQLAQWLTAKENPYFAKSVVNRFWSYFMGVGIIDPVDDIRSSNPPTNPALLEALTHDFVDSGFDLKKMMRTIVNSRTYQLSIEPNQWNKDDNLNFSHALPRRLSAEQLQDAITVALDVPTQFQGLPVGFHANQLPDSSVAAEFLDEFGRPARQSSCECERSTDVSLKQTLNMINGPAIGDAVANPNNRIARIVKTNPTDAKLIEEIYLAVLCRQPNAKEAAADIQYFQKSKDKLEAAQDLAWALLNTPGFLFNR